MYLINIVWIHIRHWFNTVKHWPHVCWQGTSTLLLDHVYWSDSIAMWMWMHWSPEGIIFTYVWKAADAARFVRGICLCILPHIFLLFFFLAIFHTELIVEAQIQQNLDCHHDSCLWCRVCHFDTQLNSVSKATRKTPFRIAERLQFTGYRLQIFYYLLVHTCSSMLQVPQEVQIWRLLAICITSSSDQMAFNKFLSFSAAVWLRFSCTAPNLALICNIHLHPAWSSITLLACWPPAGNCVHIKHILSFYIWCPLSITSQWQAPLETCLRATRAQ